MSTGLICAALLFALVLPYLLVRSSDKDNSYKDYFLLAACLDSAALVYCLIMLMTML
ncbi:MAG: hypothetical protein IJF15_04800 [Oscillospiraceae bacterium]|nr:hypothetical protein [Oscillospiraceae bacterium]